MNDEKKTTEAEQTKPGDMTDSIARMTACLEDVIANAKAALEMSKNMDRDDMKWMTLVKAIEDVHARTRIGWQQVIDPTAPEMLQGLGQVWKAIGTDTCGIRKANGTVRAWVIRENAGVEVFAKQIFKDGKPEPCWTFSGTVDCEKVIFGGIIGGRNKANKIVRFIRNGLLASRLRKKHYRMNKKVRVVVSGRPDYTVIDDPGTGKGEPCHD